MNKKKILIVNNNMHLGGVQKSLVNLLGCIHDHYDITLLLFHPAGELMGDIPADVKIIPVKSAYRFLGMTRQDVSGRPLWKLGRSFFAAVSRLLGRDAAISLMAPGQREIGTFDVAVSFLHDSSDKVFYGGCNDFVLRHIRAKKKVTFLHCDYGLCGADTARNNARYARFDAIAACSDGCRRAFVQILPELADRTYTVCNCQDYDGIRRAAEEQPVTLPDNRVNILTVARLGKEKGVIRAIEALGMCSEALPNYHYYIIGDGIQREQIEEMIHTCKLDAHVTMLGEMDNPYGYMKAADLLLIPSVSEAAPMVIGESACLGTPILSTRTSSAQDMVADPGFGWVCENSMEGIRDGLVQYMEAIKSLEEKADFLRNSVYGNEDAMQQIETVLLGL